MAGAMGVKFLAQVNNSGRKSQLGNGACNHSIYRPMPYQPRWGYHYPHCHLGYHCYAF